MLFLVLMDYIAGSPRSLRRHVLPLLRHIASRLRRNLRFVRKPILCFQRIGSLCYIPTFELAVSIFGFLLLLLLLFLLNGSLWLISVCR
jgi:hypothetical protein